MKLIVALGSLMFDPDNRTDVMQVKDARIEIEIDPKETLDYAEKTIAFYGSFSEGFPRLVKNMADMLDQDGPRIVEGAMKVFSKVQQARTTMEKVMQEESAKRETQYRESVAYQERSTEETEPPVADPEEPGPFGEAADRLRETYFGNEASETRD